MIRRRALVAGMKTAAYIRAAALDAMPRPIPAINREAWVVLARACGNLNQIARHLNEAGAIRTADQVGQVRSQLEDLRRALLGVVLYESED